MNSESDQFGEEGIGIERDLGEVEEGLTGCFLGWLVVIETGLVELPLLWVSEVAEDILFHTQDHWHIGK